MECKNVNKSFLQNKRYYILVGDDLAWKISLTKKVWGFTDKTKGSWNKSNYGDYIAFYVTQPLGKIVGFGKITDKYIDDQLVWHDEILFNKSIWKYKIRYDILYLVDQWDNGINPPLGIMLNTGRKVVDKSLFMKMVDDSENKWNIQIRMI